MLGLSRDAEQEWRSTRCHSPAFSCPSSIPQSIGISCAPKTDHGAAAGIIRFYTCISAVLGPLAMGAISAALGGPIYVPANTFAALLFVGLILNQIFDPTRAALGRLDESEYRLDASEYAARELH